MQPVRDTLRSHFAWHETWEKTPSNIHISPTESHCFVNLFSRRMVKSRENKLWWSFVMWGLFCGLERTMEMGYFCLPCEMERFFTRVASKTL